jgi:hypothetical protein
VGICCAASLGESSASPARRVLRASMAARLGEDGTRCAIASKTRREGATPDAGRMGGWCTVPLSRLHRSFAPSHP